MNKFIFWHSLDQSSFSAEDATTFQTQTSNIGQFEVIPLSKHCGIIESKNEHHHFEQDQNTSFYSPNIHFNYDHYNAKSAGQHVIADYARSGQVDFNRFRNQFTAIIYDKKNERVYAAIDRFSIDKLYYAVYRSSLFISNSLDLLIAAYPSQASINPQSLFDYIYAHIIPSPDTIYKEVSVLQPSQYLRFESGSISLAWYWQPTFSEELTANNTDLKDQTFQALTDAVKRYPEDQHTGTFLSGGLDSSTVSGIYATHSSKPIHTYTMGFDQAGYDETEYANIAAKHFKTNLHHYYVTPDDVANAFEKVTTFYEQPFGNSSAVPSFLCAKFAANEGIKSMLAGDGGDEIFAGNERYAKQLVFDSYSRTPAIARTLLETFFNNSLPYNKIFPFRKIRSFLTQATQPMPERMEFYNFIYRFEASKIFTPDFLAEVDQGYPLRQKQETYNRPQNAATLNRMLYLDWKITLADNDLVKVSKACELAGIEVHYPMLDDHLVELTTKIPSNIKMKNRELRSFYKEVVTGFLPVEIINKSKHGFGLPFGEWLKKSKTLQENIYDNLHNLKKRNIINPEFIDEIIDTHRKESAASYYGTMVWILAVLEQWLSSRKL